MMRENAFSPIVSPISATIATRGKRARAVNSDRNSKGDDRGAPKLGRVHRRLHSVNWSRRDYCENTDDDDGEKRLFSAAAA